jgi:hypothetical protein
MTSSRYLKIRIKELVSWSRYLKTIRIKEQPVLDISTPSKNCQGDPAGNAGRLRSLQLCVLSRELKAQTLIRCTLMVNHKQQTWRIQESSPIFLIFVLSTIQWFVKTAHCIMGNSSFSNNGLTPLSPFPSYSALPQIPLPLLVLGVNLWPHKASIWVVSLSKVSHIDYLPELLRFTRSFKSTPESHGTPGMLHETLQTLISPLWKHLKV